VKRRRHCLRTLRPYAAYMSPFRGVCVYNGRQAAELEQERSGRLLRDARNRCESRLSCCRSRWSLRALCVHGAASVRPCRSALGQSMEPDCGVLDVVGPNDLDAHVHYGDADAANRRGRHRPVVQTLTLDDQIAECRNAPHAPDLRPERAVHDREMQATRRLPFDDRSIGYFVIACPKRLERHRLSEVMQRLHDRLRFPGIDHDPRHRRSIHRSVCRVSAQPVSELQQLALSRSESA
jgi:hypothetical protein